jgi:hypothetical protein
MKPVPDVVDAGVVVMTGTAVTVVGTPDGRPENVEGTCVIVFGTCVIVVGSGVVIVCGTGGIGSIGGRPMLTGTVAVLTGTVVVCGI